MSILYLRARGWSNVDRKGEEIAGGKAGGKGYSRQSKGTSGQELAHSVTDDSLPGPCERRPYGGRGGLT